MGQIVITGASSAIGWAIAEELSTIGKPMLLQGTRKHELPLNELSANAEFVMADFSSPAALEHFISVDRCRYFSQCGSLHDYRTTSANQGRVDRQDDCRQHCRTGKNLQGNYSTHVCQKVGCHRQHHLGSSIEGLSGTKCLRRDESVLGGILERNCCRVWSERSALQLRGTGMHQFRNIKAPGPYCQRQN